MARNEDPDAGREGSVAGYDRDVERLDAQPWIDDVVVLPPAGPDVAPPGVSLPTRAQAVPDISLDAPMPESPPVEAAETRHLDVGAPTEVRPGRPFAVHVQITVERREGTGHALRAFAIPREGRDVHLDLIASAPLAARSDTSAVVRVRPGEDSDPVRFELAGTREGRATIEVRAFADQSFVGSARVALTVHEDAGHARQQVRAGATLAAADEGGLTLEIRQEQDGAWYEFQLRGPAFTQRPLRVELGRQVERAAQGLQQQLNELARGRGGYSPAAVQAILRGQGAAIWELLPAQVREQLLRGVGNAERLCILTEHDPVPWELVFASGTAQDARGFLSDLYLVTRWQYGAGAPRAIGRGERCYVLPPGGPASAASEIASVAQRIGSGVSASSVDEVLAQLDRARFGLLHVAAHNVPSATRPQAGAIALDQPFIQAMVGADRRGALAPCAPLVFVNACSSATPTLAWSGAEGWAERFLTAGAGAFVGSLWEIRDRSAAAFAEAFYEALRDTKPVGVAYREARHAIAADGDPTWLAYTLYADPLATFEASA